jgi:hypothetical protein
MDGADRLAIVYLSHAARLTELIPPGATDRPAVGFLLTIAERLQSYYRTRSVRGDLQIKLPSPCSSLTEWGRQDSYLLRITIGSLIVYGSPATNST